MPAVKTLTPEVRGRLVDLAAHVLAEEGVAALTLRRLATLAGTSTMAVYTLFGDKAGLLAAMHEEGFRRLGQALQEVPETDDPLEHLAETGLAYRRAALASPELYRLMFGAAVPGLVPDAPGQAAADAAYAPLLRAVERCLATGALLAPDAGRAALHLWAVAHGMVSIELAGAASPPAADPAALYADALVLAVIPYLPRQS